MAFSLTQLQDPESSTFTYFLSDKRTKEAIVIDPVLEQAERDTSFVEKTGLHLRYAVNTHCHADHITGTGALKQHFPSVKSVISQASRCKADVNVKPGDKLTFGDSSLQVLATPGHTSGCVTYYSPENGGAAFTGDTLLIQGCGRTDFQGGNARQLYNSVHTQLFTLPNSTTVYPAHDYKGRTSSTVLNEKTSNPRLSLSEDNFVELMQNLGLPYPKQIDKAVPANLVCGMY